INNGNLSNNHLQSALSDIAVGCVGQTGASIAPVPKQSRSTNQTQSIALKIQIKIYQGLAQSYLDNDQLFEAKEALDEVMKIGGLDNQTLYLVGSLLLHRCKLFSHKSNFPLFCSVYFVGMFVFNSYFFLHFFEILYYMIWK
ncbi:unnamed protein product, partial [Trichobilharzia regenti]